MSCAIVDCMLHASRPGDIGDNSWSTRALTVRPIETFLSTETIKNFCDTLPQLEDIRRTDTGSMNTTAYDLVLVFATSDGASEILNKYGDKILLDGREYELRLTSLVMGQLEERTITLVSRIMCDGNQRLELQPLPLPQCSWCLEEKTSMYTTPCSRSACSRIMCHDCTTNAFGTALKDISTMPVKCCGVMIHPDVGCGILSEALQSRYKDRYEELNTVAPVYCPVASCSRFIAPRYFTSDDKVIMCPTCQGNFCLKCRQSAEDQHACSDTLTEARQIMKQFGYKTCPRCGHGSMKMWGCNHVRCVCGWNYCWSCRQQIDVCFCTGEIMDPYDTESDALQDEEPRDTPAAATVSGDHTEDRQTGPPEPQSSHLPVSIEAASSEVVQENLDAPNAATWESILDLGDEPTGEQYFGCTHYFSGLVKSKFSRYWMTVERYQEWNNEPDGARWEKQIECLVCRDKATIMTMEHYRDHMKFENTIEQEETEETHHASCKVAFSCGDCGLVCCRSCVSRNKWSIRAH